MFRVITAIAAVAVGFPTLSFAQANDSGALEEIMVTAERRQASIQEVPIAVSAFGQEAIEKLQIDETLDLINVIPNLFGGNNTGLGTANMYYLRAQGNDESVATFDPPVGTYVDDVYITRQNANNFSFFDVERIEVLRGPQGTLFGRNTTGGAINIILAKPAEELGGFAEVGFGRFNEALVRGSIDIPFSDRFLTKFSAFFNEDDGWLDNTVDGNTYNDRENIGFRGAFRYLPTDNVTWDLSVDYLEGSEANINGALVGDKRESTSILPDFPVANQKSDNYGNDTEMLSLTSNLSWGMGAGTASVIVGYRDLEQKFLLNFPGLGSDDFFWIDNSGQHEMLTGEFKWNAELMDGDLNLVAGLFYMDEDNTTDFADFVFTGRIADRIIDNTTQSWALYAQGDVAIGDNGTLTLGARFTDEEKDIGLSDNTGNDSLTTANLIAAGIPTTITDSQVTPRIAYRHQFSDDLMGYVSATNGFKSGGWNARGGTPASFQPFGPEEVWSYEVGMRSELSDGRIRINGTLFYTDLKDLQTTSATPTGAFLTTNAGGLEVPGFELEVTALPTDNWEVFFALGLQNAEYVDLPEGCTAPNTDFAAFDVNCDRADPKRSPDVTWTLSTSYNWAIPALGATLRPTVSGRKIGPNVVGTRQLGANGSEFLVNATLSLTDDNNVWQATIECQNCSDEEYVTSFLFGDYWTSPMTWQARVRFNFGQR
jgi:iron complex outermembrane receptor protein